MGRKLRSKKRIDYHKVNHKYDGLTFKPTTVTVKVKKIKLGFAGRAASAPTATTWPFTAMHQSVDYIDDIDNSTPWATAALADDVKLPFAWLDPSKPDKWQGLIQEVAIGGDAAARLHFDAITRRLTTATSNPTITEAVGEAAAAMAMLAAGNWEMIWGFHLHAGTGIDQIWRQAMGGGRYRYHIVEAKGPGAGLTSGLFLPPGYAQMERGWVVNHLQSMNANGHAAGTEIATALGLTFNVAHPHYQGASKSYHGLATKGANATGRLTGQVVTASWQADGRLGWVAGGSIAYI